MHSCSSLVLNTLTGLEHDVGKHPRLMKDSKKKSSVFSHLQLYWRKHFQVSRSFQHYRSVIVSSGHRIQVWTPQGSFVVQAISHLKSPEKKTNCIALKDKKRKSYWLIIHWNENNPGKTFDYHFLHSVSIVTQMCFSFINTTDHMSNQQGEQKIKPGQK